MCYHFDDNWNTVVVKNVTNTEFGAIAIVDGEVGIIQNF